MRRAWMLGALILLCLTTGAGASAGAALAASSGVLVGNQQLQGSSDNNPAGMAQAFSYTATASGTTSDIDLYVDTGTTATNVLLGLYSDAGGKPDRLLAAGSLVSPRAAAWNDVPMGQTSITQGTTYWIALLPTGGQLNYLDSAGQAGADASYVAATLGLPSLPTSYLSGHEWNASPASVYVNGQLSSGSPAPPPSNTALPTISGTPQQGNTLTTSSGSWSGAPTSYAYQWQACNSSGSSCSNISGATSSSYTLTTGDVSHTLRSVVTATNSGGSTPATSNPTATVAASGDLLVGNQQLQGSSDNNPAGMAQAFSYTATASGTTSDIDLYVDTGTTATNVLLGLYSDSSGQPGTLLAHGSIGSPEAGAWNDAPVGQTAITQGTTYWIALLPTGGQLNYLDSAGQAASGASYVEATSGLPSLPTGYLSGHKWNASPASLYVNGQLSSRSPAPPPSNTALPTVSGTAQQGDTLTTSNGSWTGDPTSYAYQWQACDSQGAGCSDISGATSSAYVVGSGDIGSTVRAVVRACNASGCASAASAPSRAVVGSGGSGGSGGSTPSRTSVPTVMDTTILNNYEAPDVVQSSAGAWDNCSGGYSCTYTYQFQRCTGISGTTGTGCTNIGSTPQCSATAATTCNYTLAPGDVGDYIVSLVTATNGAGSSSPLAGQAEGPVVASRVEHFCNISAAYTNLTTGPHLCGWPDSTNVGYQNAPGYPGSLTPASPSSSACQLPPQSNHTYRFCSYAGLNLPSNLTNVTFYGDAFRVTNPQNGNVTARAGDNNITFDYDTFQPNVAAPPVTCTASYQYGVYNEGGAMTGYTVQHSDFWGFGNAIDTSGSTQANPQIFKYNWIHDTVTTGGCGYHNDGIGYEGGVPNGTAASEKFAIVDHNTIQMGGNTETIAWQEGTYANVQNTNNLLSGDPYAGARCTGSECTAPTNIVTTGNTFSTYLPMAPGNSVIDGATHYWTNPGGVWRNNFWAVPLGAPWGTPAYNGFYWVPTGNSSVPQDCGFVSATDYPNYTNLCR